MNPTSRPALARTTRAFPSRANSPYAPSSFAFSSSALSSGALSSLASSSLALFVAASLALFCASAARGQSNTSQPSAGAKAAGAKTVGANPAASPGDAAAPRSNVIDSARLLRDVQTLSADDMEGRRTGTPGGAKARAYVVDAFKRAGLEHYGADYLQPFTFARRGETYQAANVVGFIRGKTEPARVIVVSAHYDHLGVINNEVYNGADDNASGTSALMAMADYFSRHRPAHTIVFVAFDGEEEGLQGSQYFVKSPPLDLKSVVIDVNMDMVSRNDRGELYAAGAFAYPFLRPYLEEIAKAAPVRLLIGHDDPKLGHDDWTLQSDQGAFHLAGIPFVYFGVEDHEDYHKPTDDFAKINRPFFVHSAETILSFVQLIDKNLDQIAAQAKR
ncbi:MAG: M28 family peptidase [Acidobacteriota bacterium]|nr:M28 family peptidase [Acidobacteriota bacterium]